MKVELSIQDLDLILTSINSREREIFSRYQNKPTIPKFEYLTINNLRVLSSRLTSMVYSPKEFE